MNSSIDETLFISDVHLAATRPRLTNLLLNFLRHRAPGAEALYILGDLFDAWIGDDDDSDLANSVIGALRSVSEQGVRLYLQHGNRDFLIGERFLLNAGCSLLDETVVIDIAGEPTLLMHGDLLCTDDIDYQKARNTLREPANIEAFLSKSLAERRRLADTYRKCSTNATSHKAANVMDANPATVIAYIRRHQVTRVIHGHTHRPRIDCVAFDGTAAKRYVLGAWTKERGSVLVARNDQLAFESIRGMVARPP